MNTLTEDPVLDKINEHRKDTNPEYFKLATDLPPSSGTAGYNLLAEMTWFDLCRKGKQLYSIPYRGNYRRELL